MESDPSGKLFSVSESKCSFLRLEMRSGHFHSSENRRLLKKQKNESKQVSLFYNTFFQHAFLLLCHVHIAILNPDMM